VEDVPLLAEHFLRSFAEKTGRPVRRIGPEAMQMLLRHAWPGNIRELSNVIERAAVMARGEEIQTVELPPGGAAGPAAVCRDFDLPLKEGRERIVSEYERNYLSEWLRRLGGNIQLCAKQCGIDPKTLYRKMTEYGLDKHDFRH